MVGAIQFLFGLLRLGFVVNFLSHPVISGFTSAAAIIIGVSQLKHLLGLDIPRSSLFNTISAIAEQINFINWTTFAIGISAILIILFFKKWNRKIPSPLIVVVLGVLLVFSFSLESTGVKILKDIPSGLPSFRLPAIEWAAIVQLMPFAITIAMIGFMESIAVAKAIQRRHRNYTIEPNQELIALGLSNAGAFLFQGFPIAGGFGRTAVNDQAGAKTGIAAIISAFVVLLTLLFFTDYFYYLPKAVLAAIIMVAVIGLIDLKEIKHLWRTDKRDWAMLMMTALATLLIGVEEGILVGVALSILMLLHHVSNPHFAELGRVGQTSEFLNVNRHPHVLVQDDVLIFRFDAQLFFANSRFFQEKLAALEKQKKELKTVVLDASGINGLDSSAVQLLKDLVEDYRKRKIRFIIANARGPMRDVLKINNMVKRIGADNFYLSVNGAINELKKGERSGIKDLALQSNID
ncbi:UNVERIFIED_CONTAM: hypothetical protein GTU68_019170 [Idotea baltica]|nr:hypothetical protein [Idotea baltica]